MAPDVTKDDVKDFYADLGNILEKMSTGGNLHGGYYDDEHTDHESAVENMQRKVAEAVDVGPGDRVLDVGCGIGGPAVWLAKECGAEVVGINIDDDQLELCRRRAADEGVEDRVSFRHDDLTEMETLDDDSFDVVFAIEAVTYAEDKSEFAEQACRVLNDGGRLTVGEGFLTERDLTPEDEELIERICTLWTVPGMDHIDDFTDALTDEGFTNVQVRDASGNVEKSTERLARFSRIVGPFLRVLELFGLTNQSQIDVLYAYRYQQKAHERDLTSFAIVSAEC
ncbi:hypothetical protein BRC81_09615 [Halobacteriales archaeon QS_1_68_20]|nr:MAG: hypothetical protein BRC81_09615 [Halobacteriales archaeon QS_1_68_20]